MGALKARYMAMLGRMKSDDPPSADELAAAKHELMAAMNTSSSTSSSSSSSSAAASPPKAKRRIAGSGGGAESEWLRSARIHTFELWQGDVLAAGEIGCVVGGLYTSFTGFYKKDDGFSGAGSVQLAMTGRLLEKLGYDFWDLGQVRRRRVEGGGLRVEGGRLRVEGGRWRVEGGGGGVEANAGDSGGERCHAHIPGQAVLRIVCDACGGVRREGGVCAHVRWVGGGSIRLYVRW